MKYYVSDKDLGQMFSTKIIKRVPARTQVVESMRLWSLSNLKTLYTLDNYDSTETIRFTCFGLTIVGPGNLLFLNTAENDNREYGILQCLTLIKYAKSSTIKVL